MSRAMKDVTRTHTHVSYYNKLIPTRRYNDTRQIRPYMVQETSYTSGIIYIYMWWTLLVLPRNIKHVVLAIPLWMVGTLMTDDTRCLYLATMCGRTDERDGPE